MGMILSCMLYVGGVLMVGVWMEFDFAFSEMARGVGMIYSWVGFVGGNTTCSLACNNVSVLYPLIEVWMAVFFIAVHCYIISDALCGLHWGISRTRHGFPVYMLMLRSQTHLQLPPNEQLCCFSCVDSCLWPVQHHPYGVMNKGCIACGTFIMAGSICVTFLAASLGALRPTS